MQFPVFSVSQTFLCGGRESKCGRFYTFAVQDIEYRAGEDIKKTVFQISQISKQGTYWLGEMPDFSGL